MKTGFKSVIKEDKEKKVKSPWTFHQPPYDERSSCFVSAGTHHGVGHKQPVGSLTHKKENVIPKGRVNTLQTYNINYEMTNVETGKE
jgi:hypothetical protein